jgi:hypothetical protein
VSIGNASLNSLPCPPVFSTLLATIVRSFWTYGQADDETPGLTATYALHLFLDDRCHDVYGDAQPYIQFSKSWLMYSLLSSTRAIANSLFGDWISMNLHHSDSVVAFLHGLFPLTVIVRPFIFIHSIRPALSRVRGIHILFACGLVPSPSVYLA